MLHKNQWKYALPRCQLCYFGTISQIDSKTAGKSKWVAKPRH